MDGLFYAVERALTALNSSLCSNPDDIDGAILLLENILQRLYHFNFAMSSCNAFKLFGCSYVDELIILDWVMSLHMITYLMPILMVLSAILC